jgi:hypothetical protein
MTVPFAATPEDHDRREHGHPNEKDHHSSKCERITTDVRTKFFRIVVIVCVVPVQIRWQRSTKSNATFPFKQQAT